MKDLFGKPDEIPGINGAQHTKHKLFGPASHNVTKGHIGDVVTHTLKGNPLQGGSDIVRKIAGK